MLIINHISFHRVFLIYWMEIGNIFTQQKIDRKVLAFIKCFKCSK